MKRIYILPLMVLSLVAFGAMAWWGYNSAYRTSNKTNTVAKTNTTVNTNGTANQNASTNTNDAVNTNSDSNDNSNANSNSNTNSSTTPTTTGNVPTFFASTSSSWRPTTKTHAMPNGRTLTEYAYDLSLGTVPGSHISRAATGVTLATAQAVPDTTAEVVDGTTWDAQMPTGKAFMKVNWFCSAALTHLTNTTNGASQLIGDFTGDCTNSNVSVKGNFLPVALGDFSAAKPLTFSIASEHQSFGNTTHLTSDAGECVIDHIKNAGTNGVYAVQYTCDDGYSIGRTVITNVNGENVRVPSDLTNKPTTDTTVHPDDIQFTVYVFPGTWNAPTSPLDLLTTADKNSDDDGDGLTFVQELQYKTNPNNSDSDYDGLGDFEEIFKYKTDPMKADTDGDGYKDGAEVAAKMNPLGTGAATAEQLAAWGVAPSQPGKSTISDIKATYTNGNVTVTWKVNPVADGIVNWGPTADYGQHISDQPFTSSHTISFPATAGQLVHYAIRSCTPAPNAVCTVSADLTYTPK